MAAVQLLAGEAAFRRRAVRQHLQHAHAAQTGRARHAPLGDAGRAVARHLGGDARAEHPDGVETELFAFGRLPLAALSARCFTARARTSCPGTTASYAASTIPTACCCRLQEGARFSP